MFKNILKKFAVAMLGVGAVLVGASLATNFAQADNGLLNSNVQINANANARVGEHAKVKFHNDVNMGVGLGNIDKETKKIIKPAKTTLKQTIKEANSDFRDAKKTAKVQMKASIKASTNQTEKITAIKAYFTNILVALKAKNATIEAALQAFINTNFSI